MPEQPAPAKKKRSKLKRASIWSVVSVVALVCIAALGVVYLMGRPITAPDWVRVRIEERLVENLPQARISFGDMVFVVDEGWRPRLRLTDTVISTPEGAEIAAFAELRTSLSMRGLMDGKVQPRSIVLQGANATLTREADGGFTLSGGIGIPPRRENAKTVPELIEALGAAFGQPALEKLANVELRGLTLHYMDDQSGRKWNVEQGRFQLQRTGRDLTVAADLSLVGGKRGVARLEANFDNRIGETAAEFGVSFENVSASDIAAQGPAFAWLQVLQAPISGAVRSGIAPSGRFTPLNATLQIGAGVVQPNPNATPVPFDRARSYFSYDPDAGVLSFSELSVNSQYVSFTAEGDAVLGGVGDGALTDLTAQFRLRDMVANPADLYPAPVSIEGAEIDAQIKFNPFRVSLGRLQIADMGRTLIVDGDLRAGPEGWKVAVDGRMDALDIDRLLTLWPERLKPKTRNWLADNLLAVEASDIDIAFRAKPGAKPQTYLALDFADADARFLKFLPPVTGAEGHLSLAGNRFVVSVDAGKVLAPTGGAVDVAGTSFIMPDVTVKDGAPGIARVATRSTVTAMLSLLNQPPLSLMDKAGQPVTLADGQAVMEGTLAFPIRKGGDPNDLKYDVAGKLLALRSDTLVKDRTLSAPELSLVASNEGLSIGGAGQIDGVAFDGTWSQPRGPQPPQSTITADVALTPEALSTFGIALPPGTVGGRGTGKLDLALVKGQAPTFEVTSNLQGVRLSVPQISWTKPAAASGDLRVSGRLGATPRVDSLAIEAAGLSATGSVQLAQGGTLERVRFDRVSVGNWLDVPVDLIGQGKGRPVQVAVRGGTVDLPRAQFGKSAGGGGAAGPPLLLSLDALRITDKIALTNMKGRFEMGGGMSGTFDAQLNGGSAVQGTVVPQGGRSAVQLVSGDAGGALRSAGLLKQVRGGALSLTLLPVGSGGAFDGRLTIDNVTIQDAPGIAALVNAVSVVGLVNELNGDGIYFDDVLADFRLTPNRITLTNASATGASLGISMDGVFATDTGRLDMQGVISPAYFLNGIGSFLTRRGEGLIGFNYTLRGSAAQPAVSVNPLSALTPGMFREIFRAPPPELPSVDGVTRSRLPDADPPPQERQKPVARPGEDR